MVSDFRQIAGERGYEGGEFFGPIAKLAQLVDLDLDSINFLVNLLPAPLSADHHILQADTQSDSDCWTRLCCE